MKKCILKAHAIKDDSHREILYDCAKCRIQTEGMYFFYFPPWTANLWGSTVQCRYNRMLFLKFDVRCGGNNAEGAISNQAGETLAATD